MPELHRMARVLALMQVACISGLCDWVRTSFDTTIRVEKIAALGPRVFAIVNSGLYPAPGLYLSKDHGINWARIQPTPSRGFLSGLNVIENKVYIGGSSVSVSADSGESWTRLGDSARNVVDAAAFAGKGSHIFAAAREGWSLHLNPLTGTWDTVGNRFGSFARDLVFADSLLYAGDLNKGLSVSKWPSQGWKMLRPSVPVFPSAQALLLRGNTLFAGIGNSLFKLSLGDTNLQLANGGMPGSAVHGISAAGTSLFVGLDLNGVYRSTDEGGNWQAVNQGLARNNVWVLGMSGQYLFAQIYSGNGRGLWRRPLSDFGPVKISPNAIANVFSVSVKRVNEDFVFDYFTPENGDVEFTVHNFSGRLLERTRYEVRKGRHKMTWNPLNLKEKVIYKFKMNSKPMRSAKGGILN